MSDVEEGIELNEPQCDLPRADSIVIVQAMVRSKFVALAQAAALTDSQSANPYESVTTYPIQSYQDRLEA